MQVSDEAVQAALARRADLLADRPDPTALSEETLTRLMLEAAAPILAKAQGVTVTEWGVRYDEEFVQRVHDEATARKIARAGKSLGHVPVSRKTTVGPWEEMPDA